MAKDKDESSRVRELEKEIEIKDQELDRAHKELLHVNASLEKMILDLTQELKMASLIQKVLSPTEIPSISGIEFSTKFVPGTKSGGDYFDIFEHEDKLKFGVILASSTGYAMSALFLSVIIKMAGQMQARKGLEPHEVIQSMASELVPNIQNEDKASLFYGFVNRRTFELSYCCVGNVSAFHQIQGQEKVMGLEASTGPLCKGFSQIPKTQKIQLGPRDRWILCTEGVATRDNLAQVILRAPRSGVHDLRNEILFQAEKTSGLSEPLRDQTVIVTEVKDRVIKLAKR